MTPAVWFAVIVVVGWLLVYAVCVVSGRCSEDERRRWNEWKG